MDVVTIGEAMVLFTPCDHSLLEYSTLFTKRIAGAESNVAIALARLGHRVAWLSKLGNDGFGRYVLQTLRGEGVDVTGVVIDPYRPTGVFFRDKSSLYGVNVQYYRQGSAASNLHYTDIELSLLSNARFLHITGVTPALSETNREMILAVVKEAKRQGVQIAFDPNLRLKLWSLDQAIPVLQDLARYADIVLPGLDEGVLLSNQDTPERIAEWFLNRGSKLVAIKLGERGAYYQTPDECGYVAGFSVEMIDEIGAGDAFAAGVLSGLLDHLETPDVIRRGCALGAIAVSGQGDYEMLPRRSELEIFLNERAPQVKR
ncbi:MAG: sugar kinase [Alicyclobacillus sp.]|nr:sugar kinase [Alicyclobacillus sp.]